MTDVKLPKRVLRVIENCRRAQQLLKTYRFKSSGETEVAYTYVPSGKPVGPASAEEAIASGLLIPNGDGLFDDGTSQTWRAA